MRQLTIYRDKYPANPREEWDNLGVMLCLHGRYSLGDTKPEYGQLDGDSWDECRDNLEKQFPGSIILPLYLIDHSGISINTSGFGCRWDSGQVGFIFISREKIISEYGNDTDETRKNVEKYLKNEVKTYDDFLRGDVFGFTLADIETCPTCKQPHETIIDSCGGFYGDNHKESGLFETVGDLTGLKIIYE